MLDVVVSDAVEWVFLKVEDRYGLGAAWAVCVALSALFLGGVAAVFIALL